jgi:hypothetical protein
LAEGDHPAKRAVERSGLRLRDRRWASHRAAASGSALLRREPHGMPGAIVSAASADSRHCLCRKPPEELPGRALGCPVTHPPAVGRSALERAVGAGPRPDAVAPVERGRAVLRPARGSSRAPMKAENSLNRSSLLSVSQQDPVGVSEHPNGYGRLLTPRSSGFRFQRIRLEQVVSRSPERGSARSSGSAP